MYLKGDDFMAKYFDAVIVKYLEDNFGNRKVQLTDEQYWKELKESGALDKYCYSSNNCWWKKCCNISRWRINNR